MLVRARLPSTTTSFSGSNNVGAKSSVSNKFCSRKHRTIVNSAANVQFGKRGFAAHSSASCLVVAEHDTTKLQAGTLHTITAATQLSSDVTVLLAGSFQGKGKDLASEVAKVQGVKRVVLADDAALAHFLPEV